MFDRAADNCSDHLVALGCPPPIQLRNYRTDRRLEARVRAVAIRGALLPRQTGKSGDVPGWRDLSDRSVELVRDVHVARRVDSEAFRIIEPCRGAEPIRCSSKAGRTGERDHVAGGRDHANRLVVGVGDINVAQRIDGDTFREVEARRGSRAIRAASRAWKSRVRGYLG